MQLGARPVVRPKLVTGSDGAVDDGIHPIVGAGRVERNVAIYVAEACDAARRIVIIGGSALRGEESHRQRDAEEAR